MMKRFLVAVCILLAGMQGLFAAAINVIVCQEETVAETVYPVRKSTQLIEQAVIDTLFDNGHIVTNEPIVTAETKETGIENGMVTASDSYMDYFVIITARYLDDGSVSTGIVGLEALEYIDLEIRNGMTGETVFKESIVPVVKEREKKEQAVLRCGSEIAGKICKEIKASK